MSADPKKRRRLIRPTTTVPGPALEDLRRLDALIPTLPPDLRILAEGMSRRRLHRVERALAHRTLTLTVVLHRIEDPHNQAAVVRTADNLGLGQLHVVPHEAVPWRPGKLVSQKAHHWIDVHRHRSFVEAADELEPQGFRLWAAALDPGARPARDIDWTPASAIVMGNEGTGLSEEVLERCEGSVTLPQYGFTASYNLSVATAMLLLTASEQRRDRWSGTSDLTPDQRMALRRKYYLRAAPPEAVRRAEEIGPE